MYDITAYAHADIMSALSRQHLCELRRGKKTTLKFRYQSPLPLFEIVGETSWEYYYF